MVDEGPQQDFVRVRSLQPRGDTNTGTRSITRPMIGVVDLPLLLRREGPAYRHTDDVPLIVQHFAAHRSRPPQQGPDDRSQSSQPDGHTGSLSVTGAFLRAARTSVTHPEVRNVDPRNEFPMPWGARLTNQADSRQAAPAAASSSGAHEQCEIQPAQALPATARASARPAAFKLRESHPSARSGYREMSSPRPNSPGLRRRCLFVDSTMGVGA